MTEAIRKKLSDHAWARWTALFIVSFTMMCGYFVTDVLSPLEDMLVKTGWTSAEYGFFAGAYSYINVLLLMLFFGGIILDKMGIRFTGLLSTGLMVGGAVIKYAALAVPFDPNSYLFGMHSQVIYTSLGFSVFGVGCEMAGITVSKIIVKWFTGRELALAMGLQVALARIGTAGALGFSLPLAKSLGNRVASPVLLGVLALCIGLIFYMVYCVMDSKLDKSATAAASTTDSEESDFKLSDLKLIFTNKGFWLITLLCLLFYAGVFPFLKFATKLMIYKYHVGMLSFTFWGHYYNLDAAGLIPAVLPFGTILLTPLFGSLYDRVGKGATLMIIGSVMLMCVHILFALPILGVWWFAAIVMVVLGIAFSLVPSAMWPSVPKIIPMKQLGSAYAIIFYIQNIGLGFVPMLIGWVIGRYSEQTLPNGTITYDYTLPMAIFACFGFAAVIVSILLRREDLKKHYGLEQANIVKK
jgi:MFS family permease